MTGSSGLVFSPVPLYHLHVFKQLDSFSVLTHPIIMESSLVILAGAQKSLDGTRSFIVDQAHLEVS